MDFQTVLKVQLLYYYQIKPLMIIYEKVETFLSNSERQITYRSVASIMFPCIMYKSDLDTTFHDNIFF
jgi:hypothetical protein